MNINDLTQEQLDALLEVARKGRLLVDLDLEGDYDELDRLIDNGLPLALTALAATGVEL